MLRRTISGSVRTSNPAMRAVPLVGSESVVIIRTIVVLPAPLGPSRPRTEPVGTLKLTSSTAVKSSKRLTRLVASTARSRTASGAVGRGPAEAGGAGWLMVPHGIGRVGHRRLSFRGRVV
ncbi:Uncharacterised protein [Mycobacteroides abscessus subsp. abscessus]|nr:Uncharacterised protein [Mycobacteroides abscessus subsp. abscessus]